MFFRRHFDRDQRNAKESLQHRETNAKKATLGELFS